MKKTARETMGAAARELAKAFCKIIGHDWGIAPEEAENTCSIVIRCRRCPETLTREVGQA